MPAITGRTIHTASGQTIRRKKTGGATTHVVSQPQVSRAVHAAITVQPSGKITGSSPVAQKAAAAQTQQKSLIHQFVFNQEKQTLIQKHVAFDAQGKPVALKEQPRQIGEDLHQAAQRLRHPTQDFRSMLTDLPSRHAYMGAIQQANLKGQVYGSDALKKFVSTAQKAYHPESVITPQGSPYKGEMSPVLAQATGQPLKLSKIGKEQASVGPPTAHQLKQPKDVHTLGQKIIGIGTKALTGTAVYPGESETASVGGTGLAVGMAFVPGLGEAELAARGAEEVAIAGKEIKGAQTASHAFQAARGLDTVASSRIARPFEAGLRKIIPEPIRAGVGAVTKDIPVVRGVGAGLRAKPIRTALKLDLAQSVIRHPSREADAALNAVKDAVKVGKDLDPHDAVVAATHLDNLAYALGRTIHNVALDPKQRGAFGKGLLELGFYSAAFPFVLTENSLNEGFLPSVEKYATEYADNISYRLGPAIQGDWSEFDKRQATDEGNAAYTLFDLMTLGTLAGRGVMGAGREVGAIPGREARPGLRLTDSKVVEPQTYGAGFSQLAQMAHDGLREMVQHVREHHAGNNRVLGDHHAPEMVPEDITPPEGSDVSPHEVTPIMGLIGRRMVARMASRLEASQQLLGDIVRHSLIKGKRRNWEEIVKGVPAWQKRGLKTALDKLSSEELRMAVYATESGMRDASSLANWIHNKAADLTQTNPSAPELPAMERFLEAWNTRKAGAVSPEESRAAREYLWRGDRMNQEIRDGGKPEHQDALDKLVEESPPLPTDRTFYRGMNFKESQMEAHAQFTTPGEIIPQDHWVSVSADEQIARDHSFGYSPGDRGVLMRLRAPKGTRALNMIREGGAGQEGFGAEREYLLPRGTKIRIFGVQREGNHSVVDAEVVGPETEGLPRRVREAADKMKQVTDAVAERSWRIRTEHNVPGPTQHEYRIYAEATEQAVKADWFSEGISPREILGQTRTVVAKLKAEVARDDKKFAARQLRIAESGERQADRSLATAKSYLPRARTERQREKAEAAIARARGTLNAARKRLKEARKQYRLESGRSKRLDLEYKQIKARETRIRKDPFMRNWEDDARAVVAKLGVERIKQVLQSHGAIAEPGYVPAIPADTELRSTRLGGAKLVRTKAVNPPPPSRGVLARVGFRNLGRHELLRGVEKELLIDTHLRRVEAVTHKFGVTVQELLGIPDLNAATRQEIEDALHAHKVDVERYATINVKILKKALRNETDPEAARLLELKDVGTVGEQLYAALLAQVRGAEPDIANSLGNYQLVPKLVFDQLQGPAGIRNPILRGFYELKGFASRTLLGYNPTWLGWQVYANAFLLGIGDPVSFFRVHEMHSMVEKLDSEGRDAWEMGVGVGRHLVDYQSAPGRGLLSAFVHMTGMQEAKAWRPVEDWRLGDVLFSLDRKQTRAFREMLLYNKARKEAWRRMSVNMSRMQRAWDKILPSKRLSTEEFAQHFEEVLKDRETLMQLAKDTNAWLGDYQSFTSQERAVLANNVMFYGFIRHSMMLALSTLPRHPIRLSILAKLGYFALEDQKQKAIHAARLSAYQVLQQQMPYITDKQTQMYAQRMSDQLQEQIAMGGMPLSMWGDFYFQGGIDLPYFGQIIPDGWHKFSVSRASALGNAVFEVAGSGQVWRIVNVINPVLTGLGEAAAGIDLYTGQTQKYGSSAERATGLQQPPTSDFFRLAAANILSLNPILRVASQSTSQYPSYYRGAGAFPLPLVGGLSETPTKYATVEGQAKEAYAVRNYRKNSAGFTNFLLGITPFAPLNTDTQSLLYRLAGSSKVNTWLANFNRETSKRWENKTTGTALAQQWPWGGDMFGPGAAKTRWERQIAPFLHRVLGYPDMVGKKQARGEPQNKASGFSKEMQRAIDGIHPKQIVAGLDFSKNPHKHPANPKNKDGKTIADIPDIGNARQVAPIVRQLAEKKGLPPSVLMGQIERESTFHPSANSGAAFGETQFTEATAKTYGVRPDSLMSQLKGQANYMSDLVHRNNGNISAALNSYYGSAAPQENGKTYAENVLTASKKYVALDGPTTYVSPFPRGASQSRTDEGVDYTGQGAIRAVGKARYLGQGQAWGPSAGGGGSGYGVLYKLLEGPHRGKNVFLYEGIAPAGPPLKVGATIKKGQTIAKFVPGGSIEMGWADATGAPKAQDTYSEGDVTKPGLRFQSFLADVGAASPPGEAPISGPPITGGSAGVLDLIAPVLGQGTATPAALTKGKSPQQLIQNRLKLLRLVQDRSSPGGLQRLLGLPVTKRAQQSKTTLADYEQMRQRLLGNRT